MLILRQLSNLFFLLGVTAFSAAAFANGPVQSEHVEAELVAETTYAVPGETLWVAIRLNPDAGWHTYWQNPGDSGLATRVDWQLEEGIQAGDIQWPLPHQEKLGELTNYGYSEQTFHLVPITLSKNIAVDSDITLTALTSWLVCKDICIPGDAELTLTLPTRAEGTEKHPVWATFFAETRENLPKKAAFDSRFSSNADSLQLQISDANFDDQSEIEFYPYKTGLVAHNATQEIFSQNKNLYLTQKKSEYFSELPKKLSGVLVVKQNGSRLGYELTARAGGTFTQAETAKTAEQAKAEISGSGVTGYLFILLSAFLGGLILNLMPCVFPVLSLKAISIVRGQDSAGAKTDALIYTAGVVISFVALAALMLTLRSGGEAIGWGFQLQNPTFVAVLAIIFFAMALSLSGALELGTGLMNLGNSLTQSNGKSAAFFTGVLAVVVASPCTAPFMGVALGAALSLPTPAALSVFIALGLGLAAPFLLLAWIPACARMLPKPGAWMEGFRQFMAFPLYLTVVWLAWVIGGLTDRSGMALLLLALTLIAFLMWLWPKTSITARALKLLTAAAIVMLLLQPGLSTVNQNNSRVQSFENTVWQPYSTQKLEELRAEGKTVFVNMTADWCITCKVNERAALKSDKVLAALAAQDVVYLRGDWTKPDPEITHVLEQFDRSGVPLYLVYHGTNPAKVLPQLLTPDVVLSALKN